MKRLLLLFICLCYSACSFADELRFPIGENENLLVEDYLQAWWWPWSSEESKKKPLFDVAKILDVEEKVSQKIIGQPTAIKITINSLLSYAAGIHDPNRPLACLLFIGPTGVGKTELAKELVRQLYHNEDHIVRINMSEFNSNLSLWRLIGNPPGFVGSELGGQLSNAILKTPNTIVLLDEFEKAHHEVRALFLHIFDEGWFKDGRGNYVNCRECIFIATSNLGAQEILKLQSVGLDAEAILFELENEFVRMLTPELYNRTEPVIFTGLTNEVLQKLVPLRLSELSQRVYDLKKVTVTFDETLVNYLREHGFNMQLGARPLQRLIKKDVESAIAKALVFDKYQAGETMIASYDQNCVVLTKAAKN